MDPKIVPGEASESDDDNVPDNDIAVVKGEASESDEEEVANSSSFSQPNADQAILPLKVDPSQTGDTVMAMTSDDTDSKSEKSKSIVMELVIPKYDSLLHRKLRERNGGFYQHLEQSTVQAYLSAAKDLQHLGHQLHKSHTAAMDASYSLRHWTNDLFNLEDKIDTIATCTLLPEITIAMQ